MFDHQFSSIDFSFIDYICDICGVTIYYYIAIIIRLVESVLS